MNAYTQAIGLEAISIADLLTATNLVLGTTQARGLIIPVPAVQGSTLSFYYKQQGSLQGSAGTLLDARAALQGTLFQGQQDDQGPTANRTSGKFYLNGADTGHYGALVVLGAGGQGQYSQLVMRFEDVAQTEGFIYLYMSYEGRNSPPPMHFADVRRYDYALSPAQIARPLLPDDYAARYTFADYQPGDTTAQDRSGNNNHAVIFY